MTLSDIEVARAVDHMLSSVPRAPQAGAPKIGQPAATSVAPASAASKAVAPPKKAGPDEATRKRLARVNSFNRLMKPPSEWNPPPAEDGIHDPESRGTQMLLPPRDAFDSLPKSKSGNRVDWVTALASGKIQPRSDRTDVDKKPAVLDFNVVREVKGSMPDVVYPHKQHTEWLDCTNCHPSIFIPAKGANAISMASILMGKQCGVCHGKVAFPVSECRKCHSKDKVTK
jgi:c(7)-type cytochrome triheme protein